MIRCPATVRLAATAAALLLVACGETATQRETAGATVTASSSSGTVALGDGRVSSGPRRGSVYSCQTSFAGGGASKVGPWIDSAAGTWDRSAKLAVRGTVAWPGASYTVRRSGSKRIITTRGVPVGMTTGAFPVESSDPAHEYDRNPNTISSRTLTLTLDAEPKAAARAGCLSMGAIGILDDGVVLFNALDGAGRDAAAHEVLDRCGGHPEMSGQYHHHDVSACVLAGAGGLSTRVGYALDGYGIYVERKTSGGALLTNADLDACHGRTSSVKVGGRTQRVYHYVATLEYPYTVGCFRGTPAANGAPAAGGGPPAGGSTAGGPPAGGPPAGGPPSGGAPSGGPPTGAPPAGGPPTGGSPAGGPATGGTPAGPPEPGGSSGG